MNILYMGNKSPKGFFTNGAGDLLPALDVLGRLYNFCNLVIIFSLMEIVMVFRSNDILQIWK